MPYVKRENGAIAGLLLNPQPGYAEEFLADDDAEVVAYLTPPAPFRDIPRPSFLFMMSKMGITEAQVEGLIGQMPEGDARDLALIVFKNQQTFKRDNSLLNTLTAAAGLTSEQVDTAWRAAEQLTW
jgi:hypothetical protein